VSQIKWTAKHYLVDIHKWRSFIALIACSVTLICSCFAIGYDLFLAGVLSWRLRVLFSYFTIISNTITGFASAFILPFTIEGMRKKRFVTPKWLTMLHYSGTICTTFVLIFALGFILPYDRHFAIEGANFYLHIICPIAVLIAYLFMEYSYDYSRKDILICMIPLFTYSLVYLVMVVFIGKENGGWDDIYKLTAFVPAYVSLPAVWLLASIVAQVIRKLSDILNNWREARMISPIEGDIDLVELNIEVYGLGRYYGLRGDKNDLSVPMDILEKLSEMYSVDEDSIYNVYMKGLQNGVKERDED